MRTYWITKYLRTLKTSINPRFCGVFFALLKRVALLSAFLLLIHACTESDEIGLDLVETRAQLHTLDTLSLRAITLLDDSVAMNFGGTNIMGKINDPVFGKTRAGIYTQTRLPMNNLSLGEHPVLDSIYLVLSYTGDFYGFVRDYQALKVYELSESFPEADTLFSNLVIPHDPTLITYHPRGHVFQPAPIDSIMIDSIMFPPQIRIRLSDKFGWKFIDANETETFENVPNYLETFKGLYITPGDRFSGLGSMYRINMLAPVTSLELHYQNRNDTISRMQRFPINEFAKRTTRMEQFGYEDTHPVLRAQVDESDYSMGDSLLFLQSLGMLRADISLPYLDELIGDPRLLINKAELIVPVAEEFIGEHLPAARELLLLRVDEDGDLDFLDDYRMGVSYFGGRLNEDKMQYTFNISKYFQQLLDGTLPNDGLALVVAGAAENASRVVVHGPGRTDNPMRLIIYYSVFD